MTPAVQQPARTGWAWAIAAIAIAFSAVNLRWIWLFRRGQPWDIDEAGYLSIALNYAHALSGGLRAWVEAVETPTMQAPLTTSLASLVFAVAGPHPVVALVVPVAAGVATIVAAGLLGRAVGTKATGVACAALVASCPLVLNYARSFSFALGATAVMTVALLALTRSRGFREPGSAVAFGFAVGLLPLARTMTVAFIPGLLIAAILSVVAEGNGKGRRGLILLSSLALAVLTAASWLAFSGPLVFGYLLSFGYGARAGEFAPSTALNLLTSARYTLQTIVSGIHGAHALLMLLAVVVSPVLLVPLRRVGPRRFVQDAIRSPLLPILLVVAEALAAITSSQNKGSAFEAPLIPALIVLSVAIIQRVFARASGLRPLGIALCTAACLVASVPLVQLAPGIARPWVLDLPVLGPVIASDGRGTIQQYEANAGFGNGNARPLDTADGEAWITLANAVANTIGTDWTAFGFRHYILNVNSVLLQLTASGRFGARLTQVEPFVTGDTSDGYLRWMTTGEAAGACRLVTIEGTKSQFQPVVTTVTMADAARRAGFRIDHTLTTPDGRTLTLWRRPGCAGS